VRRALVFKRTGIVLVWIVAVARIGWGDEDGVARDDRSNRLATVEAVVSDLPSTRGIVECVLWSGSGGFPRDTARAAAKVVTRDLEGGRAVCAFERVPRGTFAVTMLHDENENGLVDTGFLGIPVESYGFSRDPSPLLRAPTFEESCFDVGEESITVRITAR
jgi:uncharacterized protein (DUF2141 family)